MAKDILIIAGPNGAGKTTFARTFLPGEGGCLTFINADYIAQGLSPLAPELGAIRAGKLMIKEIDRMLEKGESFTIETTLSGLVYARKIPQWQALGYTVTLIFLRLPSSEAALKRVWFRVAQGGHAIPVGDVTRRFAKGLHNFEEKYKFLVNKWFLFDNSGEVPLLLEEGSNP